MTFVKGIGSGSAKRIPWINIIKPVIFLKIKDLQKNAYLGRVMSSIFLNTISE